MPDLVADSLGEAGATSLRQKLEAFKEEHKVQLRNLGNSEQCAAVQQPSTAQSPQKSPAKTPPVRTTCVPVYKEGEEILDPEQVWTPDDPLLLSELQISKTRLSYKSTSA